MDIVSRIKFFLDYRNIANSQFADKCEIPRPTVSQLLNGRNKKVSDEVISKIHTAYPELSIMWLMFGEEPMLLSNNNNNTENSDSAQLAENREIHTNSNNTPNEPILTRQDEMRIVFGDREAPNELGGSDSIPSPISKALESIALNGVQSSADDRSGKKHIVNVMVLYSDNSFVSFVPERVD